MKACRKATNSSRKLIATLPRTTSTPTPRAETETLRARAAMMNESSTASRMWPAIMLAKSRTAERKDFRDEADELHRDEQAAPSRSDRGQKCAR